MAQKFLCKEPGCTGTVTYVREVVEGLRAIDSKTSRVKIITVYLSCDKDKNHWHPYPVQREA